MEKVRIESLDSLRGVATLQVVIGHCLVALPTLGWLVYAPDQARIHDFKFFMFYSPLHFFWSATPAVFLFFVLSGYVLSLPFYSGLNKEPRFITFFLKRIVRLYLPCFIIIALSLVLKTFLYKENSLVMYSTWVRDIWSKDLTGTILLKSFFLYGDYSFNGALWTLPIEIKLSILLIGFNKMYKKANLIVSISVIILYPLFFHILSNMSLYRVIPDLYNFYYFLFFIVGAFLCKYRMDILNWINRQLILPYCLIFFVCVSIYTFQYTLWWLPEKVLSSLSHYENYMYCISGFGFIVFALSNRMKWIFNLKFFLFFGRISFSLYLIHEVVVIAVLYSTYLFLNEYIAIFLGFILSVLLAIPFYRYVEKPTSQFAKRLTDYLFNF